MASGAGEVSPNPYGQTSPYQPGTTQPLFRSQQPHFQKPRHFRPRFHQQATPYHNGSAGEGYRPQWQARIKGVDFNSPRRDAQGSNYYGSPGGYSGSPGCFKQNRGGYRGSPGGYRGSPGNFHSPRYHSSPMRGRDSGAYHNKNYDVNPGGSDDISQYYCPSMVQNPWAGLKPVPLAQHSNFTT